MSNRRQFMTAMVSTAAAVSLPGLIRAQEPIIFTDAIGRRVTLAGPAKRVVLTNHFEDFVSIAGKDGFDRIVGFSKVRWHDWRREKWNTYVAVLPQIENLVDIGMIWNDTFSVETTLTLNPDLLILPKDEFVGMASQVEQLEAAGVAVLVVDFMAQTLEGHEASIKAIGAALGRTEEADALWRFYEGRVAAVTDRLALLDTPRPKIYFELGSKGSGEAGLSYDSALWGQVMAAARGDNIAAGRVGKWGELAPEYILAAKPEVICLAGAWWPSRTSTAVTIGFDVEPGRTEQTIQGYLQRPGWDKLPAAQSGRVHAIYHEIVFGIYSFTGLEYLAKSLYPDTFADIDPHASLAAYYDSYLPVPLSGTFFYQTGHGT